MATATSITVSEALDYENGTTPIPPNTTFQIIDTAENIETLNATQRPTARSPSRSAASSDNAKAIGELKASQDQMAHLVAKPMRS